MKAKKPVKKKSRKFYAWSFASPAMNPTECLVFGWILSKAKRMDTRWMAEIKTFSNDPIVKNHWKLFDEGWFQWKNKELLEDIPYLSESTLSKVLTKFKKERLIEIKQKKFLKRYSTVLSISRKHMRINISILSKYIQKNLKEIESKKFRYFSLFQYLLSKNFTYFPVFVQIGKEIGKVDEVLFFHWIFNQLKLRKRAEAILSVGYIYNGLGIEKRRQRSLLKSLEDKGWLTVQLIRGKLHLIRKISLTDKMDQEIKKMLGLDWTEELNNILGGISFENLPKLKNCTNVKLKNCTNVKLKKCTRNKHIKEHNKNSPVSCGNAEGGLSWIVYVKKNKTGNTPPVTFFTPSASQIEDDYHRLAIKLNKIVKKHKMSYVQSSMKKWAKELRLLGKSLRDVTPEPISHIEKTIDWYEKNCQKQFTPQADSASAFREKYGRIRKQMDKTVHDDIEITPQAKSYSDQLLRLQWPELAKGQIPKIVQQGINVVNTFRKLIYDFVREATQVDKFGWPDAKDKLRFFAKDKILTHVNIENVVIEKLKRVWERNINNPNWDGDLTWNAITKNDILECPLQYQPLWKDVLSRINYL